MAVGKCKLFFSDLDGTLIFSAKHRKDGDIVVEKKDGESITCISPKQSELFPLLSEAVVPLTTRSIEQYKRIVIEGFSPKYALCSNGGILLVDGIPDEEWRRQSEKLYEQAADEIAHFRTLLENDKHRSFEIRLVDGLFLFTKSENPQLTLDYLGEGELCDCFSTGQKVYVVPKSLGKGEAVKRFTERLAFDGEIICAGDSLMDVSMLNMADTAIFTDIIPSELVLAGNKEIRPVDGFYNYVTQRVYEERHFTMR